MTSPLSPDACVLLRRLVRSLSPWRVAALPAANGPAMHDLEARGLVEQRRDGTGGRVYRGLDRIDQRGEVGPAEG